MRLLSIAFAIGSLFFLGACGGSADLGSEPARAAEVVSVDAVPEGEAELASVADARSAEAEVGSLPQAICAGPNLCYSGPCGNCCAGDLCMSGGTCGSQNRCCRPLGASCRASTDCCSLYCRSGICSR
jgi:hypothetical protein